MAVPPWQVLHPCRKTTTHAPVPPWRKTAVPPWTEMEQEQGKETETDQVKKKGKWKNQETEKDTAQTRKVRKMAHVVMREHIEKEKEKEQAMEIEKEIENLIHEAQPSTYPEAYPSD